MIRCVTDWEEASQPPPENETNGKPRADGQQGTDESPKPETEGPREDGEASAKTNADEERKGKSEHEKAGQKQLQLWWHGDKNPDLDRAWLVEGLLPETGIGLISGQWGVYKTFVALDLSLSLMAGPTFAGRRVNRLCGVLFVAVEGAFEIPLRLQCALEAKFPDVDVAARLPFAMACECPRLLDRSALETLENTARAAARRMQADHDVELGAIIIDTMSTAALFKDEDDNAEGAHVMYVLNQLARKLGCIVIAVDHFGKMVETGTRGASAKEASADVVLAVLAEKELSGKVINPRMAIRKVRGAPTGNEVPFTTRVVDARAEDGQTTLVIEWQAEQGSTAPPKEIWPPALRVFRDALIAALDGGTLRQVFGDGPTVRAVDREAVRAEFVRRFPAEGDTEERRQANRRQAFKRGLDYARAKSLVGIEVEGKTTCIWLTKAAEAEPRHPGVTVSRAVT